MDNYMQSRESLTAATATTDAAPAAADVAAPAAADAAPTAE